ncbi:hypothetical protein GW17_00058762 [Ensete ventricosum]|nr:hypothetical protein GW17_00058762 [Ensete ventricosum]
MKKSPSPFYPLIFKEEPVEVNGITEASVADPGGGRRQLPAARYHLPPFFLYSLRGAMDDEMVEAVQGVFVCFKVDLDYEFDAPRYFDLGREETPAEAWAAELWFDTAGSYPPSRTCRFADAQNPNSLIHLSIVFGFRFDPYVASSVLVTLGRMSDDSELGRMSDDSELGSGSRLLEWWSSGQEEVLQLGSAADSCKKVGSGAYIVGVVAHPYLATRLPLWLTLSSYASTTPVVLVVRDASTGEGIGLTCVRSAVRLLRYRPYLCQVGRTTTGAPIPASDQLTVLGRPRRRSS